MKAAEAMVAALQAHAPHPSPHCRHVRICTRGKHDFDYLPMGSGAGHAVLVLETEDDVDRLIRERKAVEV